MANLERTRAMYPEVQGSCFNAILLEVAEGKTNRKDCLFSLSLCRDYSSQVRMGQTCTAEGVDSEKQVLLPSTLLLF